MLLKNVSNEFIELGNLLKNLGSYNNNVNWLGNLTSEEATASKMIKIAPMTRDFVRYEMELKRKIFKSISVKKFVEEYLRYISKFTYEYDACMDELLKANSNKFSLGSHIKSLNGAYQGMVSVLNKLSYAQEILEIVSKETWEPLPSAIEDNSVENVIILSETQGTSLSNVSKDVSSIDNFLNTIRHLIKGATNDNFYLRKVETGSLEIAISCILGATQIVEFIFLYIKLCQQTEKRELKNKEKKLDIINKSLDSAKKILEIEPQNTEANEIVQRCALSIIEFLESNPKGSINGEVYDIEMENLKIEEKKKEE